MSVSHSSSAAEGANLNEALARPPVLSRRRIILGLAIGTPISAFFLWLAIQGISWSAVGKALAGADLFLVIAAVVVLMVVYLVQAERWRLIARSEGRLELRTAYSLVLASLAVNNVVPGRAGEVLRGWWLSRELNRPFSRCLSTVVVDRISDVGALIVALLISLPFVPTPDWLRNLLVVALPLAVVLFGLIVLAWWYSTRSKRGRRRAELPEDSRSFVGRQLSGFVRGLAGTISARRLPAIILWSMLAWGLWALAAGLIATSLDISLTPAELLFVTGVINLGVAIPSTPGFVGTYQWLGVASLALFGISRDDGFAFAVLLQAAWFVPVTLIGLGLIARGLAKNLGSRMDSDEPALTPRPDERAGAPQKSVQE